MDDVKKLTKEEFLKFLNCSDQKALPKKFFVKTPKNQTITLIGKPGVYVADDVKIGESSVNDKVVRIPLPRVNNLKDLSARQARATFRPQAAFRKFTNKNKKVVSSFGRKIKKKNFYGEESKSKRTPSFKIKLEKSKQSVKSLKPTPELENTKDPKNNPSKSASVLQKSKKLSPKKPE